MDKKIKSLLFNKWNLKEIHVTGDENHFKIIAVGSVFKGKSTVKRQQMIYEPLIDLITQKKIHAVSIVAYTFEEWEKIEKK
ncbi:BolA/IbaG family iron-sulfur metabolism protein [Buchnera aphidicola (Muscaphis stroyani)]|uniref:BolA/IbaG family iron-sulfur metabolism protein n=1 Tax=Buchnera aphidicola (Muscaphis stroyani) TaxID=1241869 RepID=A0A4D6YCZ3_9GAMM|nr:BolA/IbaG family iron-sulfur metabolism protein [Buchnera aphidicola]QCI24441.1 BolA/IbaG family iron-sulfur metabolism protein [Buchnera aphidicola (Muscaphis stroyani)]